METRKLNSVKIRLPAQISSLQIAEVEEPSTVPGTVKVRWRAVSLNFHDYAVASGMLPTEDGRIPCSDAAGEVMEVGEGVTKWQVGDKVMSTFFPGWQEGAPEPVGTAELSGDSCDGYATQCSVLPANALTRMPDGYSYQEAATFPCAALTAWRALFEIGNIQPGDKVLIQGTGGVSIFGLQLAKAAGAIVYATSSSKEKMQRLQALGADYTLNYRENPDWGMAVFELAQGGVDHVLDVGGGLTLSQSIDAGKMGANLVLIGILGGLECQLNLAQLLLKQQRLFPIAVGNHAMQDRMVDFLQQHRIQPVVDRTFPLTGIVDAFEHLLSGQHVGKVVLNVD